MNISCLIQGEVKYKHTRVRRTL